MTDRRFRFGVVAGLSDDAATWGEFVRRVDDLGFDVLLSPDAFGAGEPFTALASAAMASPRLRLGTFVLAVPLRTPTAIAWATSSVDRLSGGRFELGLGAGRPDAAEEAALLGVPWHSAGRRIEQVSEAIDSVRSTFAAAFEAGDGNQFAASAALRPVQRPAPPVMIAASGPKLLALGGRSADIVAVAVRDEEALTGAVGGVREAAGDRFDDIELSVNVFAVGTDDVPPWMRERFGVDPAQAADNKTLAVLTGDARTIADVLLRRRDEFGISYVTVNSFAMDAFAPVLELLAGK